MVTFLRRGRSQTCIESPTKVSSKTSPSNTQVARQFPLLMFINRFRGNDQSLSNTLFSRIQYRCRLAETNRLKYCSNILNDWPKPTASNAVTTSTLGTGTNPDSECSLATVGSQRERRKSAKVRDQRTERRPKTSSDMSTCRTNQH